MTGRRKVVLAATGLSVLIVAGGAGIAQAVSGDGAQVTGPAAEKAAAAALEAAGGGIVLEVEGQDGDGRGVYEVEIRREDGSQVEIHLSAEFEPVGSAADDDSAGESPDDD